MILVILEAFVHILVRQFASFEERLQGDIGREGDFVRICYAAVQKQTAEIVAAPFFTPATSTI